jgi:hypothetical protein
MDQNQLHYLRGEKRRGRDLTEKEIRKLRMYYIQM